MRRPMAIAFFSEEAAGGVEAPSLTLDSDNSSGAGSSGYAATFTQGGSAVALADSDTVITDPSEDGIDQLVVTGSGIVDGADEVISIGADSFPLNADQSTTEVIGGTTFAIAFVTSTKTFTVTKSGGGAMPVADLQSFIEAMTYENTAGAPTTGDRTFTFQVTDGGQNSNSAVSTITVEADPWEPVLPQSTVDTTYSLPTSGTTHNVNSGGDLQAAINAAALGDVIVLEAGATFTGNFTLPDKGAGTDWIYVISSDLANLPAGTRVKPRDAVHMPKITNANTSPILACDAGAHHYRLVGIEVTTATATYNGITAGYSSGTPVSDSSDLPDNIIVDRCLIHSTNDSLRLRSGLNISGTNIAVIDSHVSNCKDTADAQAILIWNGGGPYLIRNNYLEGTGENILFGGTDPAISNAIPSDIQIYGNWLRKRLSWKSPDLWVIKNLLEFKNARRVHVRGNVLENCWADSQTGTGILFTPRNQNGTAAWCTVEDLTVESNVIDYVGRGMLITGTDGINTSDNLKRLTAQNNLVKRLSEDNNTLPKGIFINTAGGGDPSEYVRILHNTVVMDHGDNGNAGIDLEYSDLIQTDFFLCRDNIIEVGNYGAFDPDGEATNYTVTNNGYILNAAGPQYAFYNGDFDTYFPVDNIKASSLAAVNFADEANEDYTLQNTSPFYQQAADGSDLGVDFTTLNIYVTGVDDNFEPQIDLGGTGGNYSVTFVENVAAVALASAFSYVDVDEQELASLEIVVTGVQDGADEVVTIAGQSFPMNADKNVASVTVGSTDFELDFVTSTKTFTITEASSGTMPLDDLATLVDGSTYDNTATGVTEGDRVFTFTANDGTDDSETKTATVTVEGVEDLDGGDWARRQPIVIDDAYIDANLTDFTVLLTRDNFDDELFDPSGSSTSQADGGDIRFATSTTGGTILPCHVMKWELDSAPGAGDAEVLVAVKVPSITATGDTTIYVFYHTADTKTQPATDAAYGRDNAYDSDWLGFWPDAGETDVSGNGLNGSAVNAPTIGGAAGPVAGVDATDFNGSDQVINFTSGIPTDYPVTFLCWGASDAAAGEQSAMGLGQNGGTYLKALLRWSGDVGGDPIRAIGYDGIQSTATSTAGYSAGVWAHGAGVFGSTTSRDALINGGNKGSDTSTMNAGTVNRFNIAAQPWTTDTGFFNGKLSLVQLHGTARSDAWIKADYSQIATPALFAAPGTPANV